MDIFFNKTFTCSICDEKFKEYRIKKSRERVIKVDTDFATHTSGPNPLYYAVSVCPHCGYSFTSSFTAPSTKTRAELQACLHPSPEDFSKERNLELAILSFQRAIWCATLNREKHQLLAALYLHLAWMYRFAGDETAEKVELKSALRHYLEAYQTDRRITNIAQVAYLIGEIHRRLDEDTEAVKWFHRVVHEYGAASPPLAKMARERWQEIREIQRN